MLKSFLKAFTRRLADSDRLWPLLRPVALVGIHLNHQRLSCLSERPPDFPNEELRRLYEGLRVARGPFEGLRYPEATNWGGALVPTLLGTYESEIQRVLERVCDLPLKTIVNIGCAEGYYAVGLARRVAGACVLAFDIREDAQRLCKEMAAVNNVSERVHVEGRCNRETLLALRDRGPGFLVCDIEGGELELFDAQTAEALGAFHVLVELHDFLDLAISPSVLAAFASTHDVEIYRSISVDDKARSCEAPELASVDPNSRRSFLAERRFPNDWAYFRPRTTATVDLFTQ